MQSRSLRMKQTWIVPLIALLALTGGCALKPESLAWEKIVDDWGPDVRYMYTDTSPRIVVIADRQDIAAVQNNLPPSHLQLITNTDLSSYFVVVIYQGKKGQVDYSVEVTDVRQEKGSVAIYAQFNEPKPGTPTGQAVTSPFYILKVKKTETMKGGMEFILIANGKEVVRQTHNIP